MGKILKQLQRSKVFDLKIIQHEKPASTHINITSHLDEYTLIDKNNQLIRIFKIRGVNATKLDDEGRALEKEMRNRFYKDGNGDVGMYFWCVRRKTSAKLHGDFKIDSFAKKFNDDYQNILNNKSFYVNDYYLALITKPANGVAAKATSIFKNLFLTENENAYQKFIDKQKAIIDECSANCLDRFKRYNIKALGIKAIDNKLISEPLSFLGVLLNYSNFNMLRLEAGANIILMRSKPFFNKRTGVISLVDVNSKTKFAAMLSIKLYSTETYAGMLDDIQELPIELVVTHSYCPYYKDVARKKLADTQKEMQQSADESIIQTQELSNSMEEVASSDASFGIHHMTICVFADSIDELNDNITLIKRNSDNAGVVLAKENIGSEIAFWAQLPGNFSYIARGANISTKNLASFISFHAPAVGRSHNNHWGDALSVFETIYNTPYHFNIHSHDVGVGLIYGVQGSGKTVLAGSLILQSMKFGGKRILFDKDYGLKIMVLAAGGTYFSLKMNTHSGFNPLKLEDTPQNRSFLCDLFGKMLCIYGNNLDEALSKLIKTIVDNIYDVLPYEHRVMRHIAPYFGTPGLSPLRDKFDEWHSNGRFTWVFDNEYDELDLGADIIGFDITELLAAVEVKTPIFMYLLHRANQALHGKRGGIMIDEGFFVLDDPYFAKVLVEDNARTNRKKNNFLIISTQQPEDTAKTNISRALNNVASFKVFYPNPVADESIYCKHLGLTQHELDIVKHLESQSRYFLLQFDRGTDVEIIRLNLKDMPDLLHVISGREQSVKLLDTILANNPGYTPAEWLPIFLNECKESLDGKVH